MKFFQTLFAAVAGVTVASRSPSTTTTTTTSSQANTSPSSSSRTTKTTPASLRIIQINDVYELDNFARLKSLIDYYKYQDETAPEQSIVICAGDFLSPSLLSSLDKGYAMVDILNAIGVDFVCIGNHETDIPNDALTLRIQQSNFDWVNSNMPDLNDKLKVNTPQYKILNIHNKKVTLLGFMTDDKSLYRQGAFGGASIIPVLASAKYWGRKMNDSDLIICMTHQGIALDRIMAEELGDEFPLLMGGHDHEPFNEVINGCRIVKTGMNAQKAAIIDIHWNKDDSTNTPTMSIQMLNTQDFPSDPTIEARVQSYHEVIKQLDVAKLFSIKDWTFQDVDSVFSTKNNRLGASTGTIAFCSMLRMGLRCELCLLNAGCVRGGKDYPNDHDFTWSDLKSEMPFATPMSVCKIPGKVIQDTIRNSRKYALQGIAKGGYIHASRSCTIDEEGTIESIAGEPFDPDREYLTAFPHGFLAGIDNHEPLLKWAKTKKRKELPNEHSAVPAKFALVEFFSALLWLRLGNFDEIAGEDGVITKDDVRERMKELYGGNEAVSNLMLENVFSIADRDNSGTISMLEQAVVQFAATDMLNHIITGEELSVMTEVAKKVLGKKPTQEDVESMMQQILQVLDSDGSGALDRDEMLQALGDLTEKEFLH